MSHLSNKSKRERERVKKIWNIFRRTRLDRVLTPLDRGILLISLNFEFLSKIIHMDERFMGFWLLIHIDTPETHIYINKTEPYHKRHLSSSCLSNVVLNARDFFHKNKVYLYEEMSCWQRFGS